jgi:hypothetical protein
MYPLPYIIRIVKEDEMDGHVAGMHISLLAKPEGNRLENLGQNVSTVLKWNLKK